MYKWSWVIFAKKSKFHDAGGPDTVVLPNLPRTFDSGHLSIACMKKKSIVEYIILALWKIYQVSLSTPTLL